MKITIVMVLSCVCLFTATQAQFDTAFNKKQLGFEEFLHAVGKNNPGYIAEQLNISIAEAAVIAAAVFPDPELSISANDNGQRRMRMGYGVSAALSWSMETGGKRKARIGLAKSNLGLSRALLENYFRNLRADAAISFLQAIRNGNVSTIRMESWKNMQGIATADSIRFKLGQIAEVDARQSSLEAGSMLNELHASEAEWKNSLLLLSQLTGHQQTDTLLFPAGDLQCRQEVFDLKELLSQAIENRADLAAALSNKTVAEHNLALVKANRKTDIGLSIGVANTSVVSNIVAPTPSFTSVTAGISIPLKFSNNNPGELKAANLSIQQAALQYDQVALQLRTEVMWALNNYIAAQKQVSSFKPALLADAARVLDGKTYSYRRGETSLLELLNAQRTYNDVQLSYAEALYNCAAARVELDRATGNWNIHF